MRQHADTSAQVASEVAGRCLPHAVSRDRIPDVADVTRGARCGLGATAERPAKRGSGFDVVTPVTLLRAGSCVSRDAARCQLRGVHSGSGQQAGHAIEECCLRDGQLALMPDERVWQQVLCGRNEQEQIARSFTVQFVRRRGIRWTHWAATPTVLRVSASPLRVLWICGASGAGKSVAAWGLFEELAAAGQQVAYVDIDQLGMLYPVAGDDPERHLLKSAALDALVPGYLAAGAQVLVVSGVVDIHAGPNLTSQVDLTLCLLSPEPAVLRKRVLARGWDMEDAEEAVAENTVLRNANFVDVMIESAGLSVAGTVSRLRRLAGEGRQPAKPWGPMPRSDAALDTIVVTGPRAVGSSTIGFGLAMRRWRAGLRTGFVDLQQLGFVSRHGRPATDADLSIGQLAAMHRLMAARGAGLLVVSGHVAVSDRTALRASLQSAPVTVVRLEASAAALREHVRARVKESGARLAGDDLVDADRRHQDLVVAAAVAEQAAMNVAALDDAVLEVTGRTPEEVIAEVENLHRP
jgi:broad-specificity NMP kinase